MSFVPRSVHADGGASEFINARKRNHMAPKGKGKRKAKKGKKSTQAKVTRVHHRNLDGPQISYDPISTTGYTQPRTEGESRSLWSEAVRRVHESKVPARKKFNAVAEYYGDRWAFLTDGDARPYAEDAEDYWDYTDEGRAFHESEGRRNAAYEKEAAEKAAQALIAARNPYS